MTPWALSLLVCLTNRQKTSDYPGNLLFSDVIVERFQLENIKFDYLVILCVPTVSLHIIPYTVCILPYMEIFYHRILSYTYLSTYATVFGRIQFLYTAICRPYTGVVCAVCCNDFTARQNSCYPTRYLAEIRLKTPDNLRLSVHHGQIVQSCETIDLLGTQVVKFNDIQTESVGKTSGLLEKIFREICCCPVG